MADNVEIQGLEFQIKNDSAQAVAGLQNLINTLNRLKTATNGGATGLNKTAKGIKALSDSLKGLNSGDASQKINRLVTALSSLSTLGSFRPMANALTKLNAAITNLKWTDGDKLTSLANGLRPLSELGKTNLNSFVTQLSKLPQVIADLEAADIDKFTTQMSNLASAMKPFADEMQKVSSGFSAFPSKIQKLISSTNRYTTSVDRATTSTEAWGTALKGIKISSVILAAKRIGTTLANFMYDASEWEGIVSRFGRAFGDSAQEYYERIKKISDLLQIDIQTFMQYASLFGTMLEGYGVASEDAAKMAMNYTELAYDIWAGYNDIYKSFENAAHAMRSAIAGEVEPIRGAGLSIVDSQLKATAANVKVSDSTTDLTKKVEKLNNLLNSTTNETLLKTTAANYGIAYSSQKASEELKSYLRYLTLVDQAHAQGLVGTYARELNTVEGLMRTLRQQVTSLSRELGSLFLPILARILPYVQAFVSVVRELIASIAALFGIDLRPVDFSGLSSGAGASEDIADNLKDAKDSAKKLNQYLMGFDELNVLNPDTGDNENGSNVRGAYAGMFDIGDLWDDAIFKNIQNQVEELKAKMRELLADVLAIGAGILAWKIATGLLEFFKLVEKLSGLKINWSFGITGLGLFLDGWNTMRKAIVDILENGPNLENISKLLSGFFESLGAAFIVLNKPQFAGAMLILSGVAGIISTISDIIKNGINWDNATNLVKYLGFFIGGIGLLFKNFKLGGIGIAISGIVLVVKGIGDIVEAIKNRDWSNVDWTGFISGVAMVVGGLAIAFKKIQEVKDKVDTSKTISAVKEVKQSVEGVSNETGGLSSKLKELAKNLAWGIVIIAEVAAAAIIIVGAIWILGEELNKVGEAWQPVIDNAGTIAIAMGIGTGLLVLIGAAALGLGKLGGPVALDIGIGTAILLELGVATGLFLLEIWGIGKLLDEIGKAWQPVLDNGDRIATSIGIGTGLLVGIGVVAAALGAITIGTGLLLPAAIGVGTGLLLALGEAFVAFAEKLVKVADELTYRVSPALDNLNSELPSLSDNMGTFVDFMSEFAGQVWNYTKASGKTSFASAINTVVEWFTGSPLEKLSSKVEEVAGQASDLNSKLNVAVPELKAAADLLEDYTGFIDKLSSIAGASGAVKISENLSVNLKAVGENIITGFNDGVKSKYPALVTTFVTWGKDVNKWFSDSSFGGVNKERFSTYAVNIVNGFNSGLRSRVDSAKSGIVTWANNVKRYFTDIVSYNTFYDIAKDVIRGFNNGINNMYDLTLPYMRKWANEAKEAFKAELDSNSPSKVFEHIGEDTVLGYNIGIERAGRTTNDVISSWANSFTGTEAVMGLAVDTSALDYYKGESLIKSIPTDITTGATVSITGFDESMEEFYREYIEPVLSQISEDVRRQADKNEKVVVQVGNRVVSDAVAIQQKANGYAFVR